jgi:hypothetical protein
MQKIDALLKNIIKLTQSHKEQGLFFAQKIEEICGIKIREENIYRKYNNLYIKELSASERNIIQMKKEKITNEISKDNRNKIKIDKILFF